MILLKNNYVEDERLFSTGNDELDDLLTEVYYSGIEDGYDYAQKEFAEAKLRFADRVDTNRLKNIYAGRKGEKYKESHLRQTDPDPDVRDEELRKVRKDALKTSAKISAVAIPATAALGAIAGKAAEFDVKRTALEYAGAGALGAGIGTLEGQAIIGLNRSRSAKAANGNEKANKAIRKERDEVLLAAGKMEKEDFVKKWGGKLDGQKIKGSENEK